ncbi:hypothetical protein ACIBG8_20880 [Nonomuraea sp. NPDC050556]|uniref:hypothetical protein n=1 Tax=Nonomuraea sp. NPDC050556 TaxID=3364369 RepID=UPI0037B53B1E
MPVPLAQPYRDLVWLAYLVLPVTLGEQRRLVLAHRLAAAALSGASRDPVRLRQTFLRRLLRTRIWPWSGRLALVDVEPAVTRSAEADFTAALHRLSPQVRAAYVLLTLEERPPEQVQEILTGAGVPDAQHVVYQVSRLEPLRRPAADPNLARMYGRRPVRPSRKVVVGVAACALAALFVVPKLDLSRPGMAVTPRQAEPSVAAAGAWRTSTDLDLTTWAPRGSLVGDRALVKRALAAWRQAQLIYAGRVDGAQVVLLRAPSLVARYTEDGGRPTLEVMPEPRSKPDGASPLKLRTTAAGSRYLLPPWVREFSIASLTGSSPHWRKGRSKGGVTEPIPAAASKGCWRGPVVRLRAPEIAHGLPYTMIDFGRLVMANAYYQPPPPAEINRYGPNELDTVPGGFEVWKRLGCALDRPSGEIQAATAWEFWAGQLPEGVAGRWVCLRLTDATGGSSITGVLLTRTAATITGTRTNTWDCSRLSRDIVAGTWWRGPSGKRHYVAAGSRRVVAITVGSKTTQGHHAFTGPGKLSAVNELGEKVAVLQ